MIDARDATRVFVERRTVSREESVSGVREIFDLDKNLVVQGTIMPEAAFNAEGVR